MENKHHAPALTKPKYVDKYELISHEFITTIICHHDPNGMRTIYEECNMQHIDRVYIKVINHCDNDA